MHRHPSCIARTLVIAHVYYSYLYNWQIEVQGLLQSTCISNNAPARGPIAKQSRTRSVQAPAISKYRHQYSTCEHLEATTSSIYLEDITSTSASTEESSALSLCFAHQTALADGIIIKPSEGRGYGAFATLPIPAGAWFGEYQGELLTEAQVDARYWKSSDMETLEEEMQWIESRERRNQTVTGDYIFDVGDDLYIDGEDTDKSTWCRYLNHASPEEDEKYASMYPNFRSRCNAESRDIPQIWDGERFVPPKMFFVALRDIAAGEEICFDYGEYYWDGYEEMIC